MEVSYLREKDSGTKDWTQLQKKTGKGFCYTPTLSFPFFYSSLLHYCLIDERAMFEDAGSVTFDYSNKLAE